MTRIDFIKGEGTRYRSVLHRPDGVVVELDGGSYNKVPQPVPHDLAHLIVEDELGLTQGVWGVLVAGGLFRHTKVIAGRQAPHAPSADGRSSPRSRHASCRPSTSRAPSATPSRAADDRRRSTPDGPRTVPGRLHAGATEWAALPTDGGSTEWPHAPRPGTPRR